MTLPVAEPGLPLGDRPVAIATTAAPFWEPLRRLAFRFLLLYLVLHSFPGPFGFFPVPEWVSAPSVIASTVAPWVWHHLLGHSGPLTRDDNGAGDQTLDWVSLLATALLAAVLALVWTLAGSLRARAAQLSAERRRVHERRLHAGLRIYLRYFLGAVLLEYGISKVIKTQFAFPPSHRLLEPYGEASPMGLLWTFMGYSTLYTTFAGVVECLPAVLLFFRRSTTLGAMLAVASMANVVALNFCYDVPVKIGSTNLLLVSVVLLVPDLKRLADLLVWRRETPAAEQEAPVRRAWWDQTWLRRTRLTLAIALLAVLAVSTSRTRFGIWQRFDRGDRFNRAGKFRLYTVNAFLRNGTPVSTADRWDLLTLSSTRLSVVTAGRDVEAYVADTDPRWQHATLWSEGGKAQVGELTFRELDPEHLVVTGRLGKDTVGVLVRREHREELLLVRSRAHWFETAPPG